jgi:hypothetical protein
MNQTIKKRLPEEKEAELVAAMLNFCVRCMEPAKENAMGLQKKVTEGELAILPQILGKLL